MMNPQTKRQNLQLNHDNRVHERVVNDAASGAFPHSKGFEEVFYIVNSAIYKIYLLNNRGK